MTTRERNLAVVLVAVMGTGAVAFIGFQFVLSPLLENNKLIQAKQREISDLEDDKWRIEAEKKKYESARQQSLPNDPIQGAGVAREDYTTLLTSLCRKAELNTGLSVLVSEPDSKSVPMIASKKPAYTRLSWEVKAKGDVYHVVDFLRLFYGQPLLHQIKTINLQRPSESRAQQARQLDVVIKIEALVLDNAPVRATLLPMVREIALLTGPAGYTALNVQAASNGKGSPLPPAGVVADPPRDYLSIAGKNVFFGPLPVRKERTIETPPEEDLSPYIVLTSIVGHDDGGFIAMFRDQSTNNDYTITQSGKGAIAVKGEYELNNKKRVIFGYNEKNPGRYLFYGTDEGRNLSMWRVRRVTASEVILEKVEKVDPDAEEEPKPTAPALAFVGGGLGAFVAVPEGKIYRVALDQCLDVNAKERDMKPPPHAAPTKFLLAREAWKAIYAPLPTSAAVSTPVAEPKPEPRDRGR